MRRSMSRVSWTGTTTNSSAGAGALMNILLQKFALSTRAQQQQGEDDVREGGQLEKFLSAFYCISFCCSYSRIATRIAQAEAVCPI